MLIIVRLGLIGLRLGLGIRFVLLSYHTYDEYILCVSYRGVSTGFFVCGYGMVVDSWTFYLHIDRHTTPSW